MKHTVKVTLFLVVIFFCAQIIGLLITDKYIDTAKTAATGELSWQPLPSIGGISIERPEIAPEKSFLYILGAIIIGTALILIIIKFGRINIWKLWFFIAVLVCLHIALSAFIPSTPSFLIALILSFLKVFKPNVFVHNFTELFIYGGLAVIFVPIMNMFAAVALMVVLSCYDMYAVWKSKHMVIMAKFQTKSGIFAGVLLPYKAQKVVGKPKVGVKEIRTAILGGGDIGFPLIFSGVAMKSFGLPLTFILPICVTLALLVLLLLGKKKHFYPAIPFLTIGCFVGYGLLWLITFLA
ncbi:MAG: presenilin family intramembrane aspartyl protease [Candidatus Woesearchaeota archaeon]